MLAVYFIQLLCTVVPCSEFGAAAFNYSSTISTSNQESNSNSLQSDSEAIIYFPIPTLITGQDENFTNPAIKKRTSEVEEENPVVYTSEGGLRGFTMKTLTGKPFFAFQSVPFAQSPVGELRFRAPVKKSVWSGVRDAIATSPTCLQADFFSGYKIVGQEDCLYLNVYTPKIPRKNENSDDNRLLPVIIFIHGGGFFFGSSNLYGPPYLLEEDVLVVSMNYRLGPLGFLTTGDMEAPGNNGLKDQNLALQWVKKNIQFFGGNPNAITLMGESAGASSVQFHLLSPLSRGLFNRGISESGCTTCFWSISEKAVDIGRKYASALKCPTDDSSKMMNCLRTIDGNSLVMGQLGFLEWSMYPVVIFGPVVEPKHRGAFLDDLPENIYKRGEAANVPWISGFNSDEGAVNIATVFLQDKTKEEINDGWDQVGPVFLELKDSADNYTEVARNIREYYMGKDKITFESRHNAVRMFSDRYVIICGVKSIQYHAKYSGSPVYAYHFNYRGAYSVVQKLGQKPSDWGVSHLDDLIYLVNNTEYYSSLKLTDEDYRVSRIMIDLWTNFAKFGEPSQTSPDGSKLNKIWRPVKPGVDEIDYLQINLNPKMIEDPFARRVSYWKSLNLRD